MLFKWFLFGGMAGFIISMVNGSGFEQSIGAALLAGAGAIALRKWIFRTFWG